MNNEDLSLQERHKAKLMVNVMLAFIGMQLIWFVTSIIVDGKYAQTSNIIIAIIYFTLVYLLRKTQRFKIIFSVFSMVAHTNIFLRIWRPKSYQYTLGNYYGDYFHFYF